MATELQLQQDGHEWEKSEKKENNSEPAYYTISFFILIYLSIFVNLLFPC